MKTKILEVSFLTEEIVSKVLVKLNLRSVMHNGNKNLAGLKKKKESGRSGF